ncbi:MAG: NUDIX hydrolase [Verrucomicrobiota bacterium]
MIRRVHRQSLLDQLSEYASRHPEEGDVIRDFTNFVKSESRCFERSLAIGHITGSAWVVNATGCEVLLTHHRKLDRWLQLGGHADGESDVLGVAMKEAEEESGLTDFSHIGSGIFDIDIHLIPERKGEPAHFHYDVRYVLRANGCLDFIVSEESHDLRWVKLADVKTLTTESSMMRMVAKWGNQLSNTTHSKEGGHSCPPRNQFPHTLHV